MFSQQLLLSVWHTTWMSMYDTSCVCLQGDPGTQADVFKKKKKNKLVPTCLISGLPRYPLVSLGS